MPTKLKSDLGKALEELLNGPLISATKLVRTDLHGYTQARMAAVAQMSQEDYAKLRWQAGNPLVPRRRKRHKG